MTWKPTLRFLMPAAEHTARQLEIFVEAACHYGLVLELLSVIHDMRNGRQLDAEDAQLVNTASIAALLAKVERSNRGIDSE
ncbi:hypothetical protein [Herbaspirillum sp. GCM10030257]